MKEEHILGMFAGFVAVSLLFTWFYVSDPTLNILGNFEVAIFTKPVTAVMASTFVVGMILVAVGMAVNKREKAF